MELDAVGHGKTLKIYNGFYNMKLPIIANRREIEIRREVLDETKKSMPPLSTSLQPVSIKFACLLATMFQLLIIQSKFPYITCFSNLKYAIV